MKVGNLALAFLTVCISLTGQVAIKMSLRAGRQAVGPDAPLMRTVIAVLKNPLFVGGLSAMTIGAICYVVLLYQVDLSRVLPAMGGISYLIVLAVAHIRLGESLTWHQVIGVLLLATGTLMAAR